MYQSVASHPISRLTSLAPPLKNAVFLWTYERFMQDWWAPLHLHPKASVKANQIRDFPQRLPPICRDGPTPRSAHGSVTEQIRVIVAQDSGEWVRKVTILEGLSHRVSQPAQNKSAWSFVVPNAGITILAVSLRTTAASLGKARILVTSQRNRLGAGFPQKFTLREQEPPKNQHFGNSNQNVKLTGQLGRGTLWYWGHSSLLGGRRKLVIKNCGCCA